MASSDIMRMTEKVEIQELKKQLEECREENKQLKAELQIWREGNEDW